MAEPTPQPTFFQRHEFLIRRLHSLSGLIPVGAYMCVHLMVNASLLNSPASYQKAVYQIHSLGSFLPIVEWGFIFIPILFHAIFGVVIIAGGLPNTGNYPYKANIRYTLQRATGVIAFFFIVYHVFHMHGWFHWDWWLDNVARPLGGARFAPYNAASTLTLAFRGVVIPLVYAIGVTSCVYHLANGIWTMGITWGVWTSPAAQRRATAVCGVFGLLLLAVAFGSWSGPLRTDPEDARAVEQKMYNAKVASGELDPQQAEHKRASGHLGEETAAAATEDSQQSNGGATKSH